MQSKVVSYAAAQTLTEANVVRCAVCRVYNSHFIGCGRRELFPKRAQGCNLQMIGDRSGRPLQVSYPSNYAEVTADGSNCDCGCLAIAGKVFRSAS